MPLTINEFGEIYQLVYQTTTGIPVGTVCYLADGIQGSPIGLLAALTRTTTYKKAIKTSYGWAKII